MLKEDLINELQRNNLKFAAKIRSGNNIQGSSDIAYAFTIAGMRLLNPKITDIQLINSITDNNSDAKFDVIFISKQSRVVEVYAFERKYGIRYDDAELFCNYIRKYLFNSSQALKGLSNCVQRQIKEARRKIERGYKVRLFMVSGQVCTIDKPIIKMFEQLQSEYPSIIFYNLLDLKELFSQSLKMKRSSNNYEWSIKIVNGRKNQGSTSDKIIIKERSNGPIASLLARINLSPIVQLQSEFVNSDRNLFDDNVRDFQKNKGLSKEILSTVRNNPKDFYMFHNGLTFTCREIIKIGSTKYTIKDPQIINGCQTVNTLFDAYKNILSDGNLKKSSILCRFYAINNSKKIEKVCEANNTQVKISLWDLRSNDDIQKIVETALKVKNIEYKRKKSNNKKDEIYITDLAQWIFACKFKKPAEAKNKKSELFSLINPNPPYYRIFDEHLKLKELVRICEVSQFVRKRILGIPKKKRIFEKDADLHLAAGIYYLENKGWNLDRKFKKVKKIISIVIKQLRKKEGKDISYNRIFSKLNETWGLMENKLKKM